MPEKFGEHRNERVAPTEGLPGQIAFLRQLLTLIDSRRLVVSEPRVSEQQATNDYQVLPAQQLVGSARTVLDRLDRIRDLLEHKDVADDREELDRALQELKEYEESLPLLVDELTVRTGGTAGQS